MIYGNIFHTYQSHGSKPNSCNHSATNKERQRELSRGMVGSEAKRMGGNGKRIQSASSGWNHAMRGNNETEVRWKGSRRTAGCALMTQTTV